MFQTREEVIDWINYRSKAGMKLGLERIEYILERLGNPERRFRSVHIGGTNGKGSTTSILRQILQEAGFTIGTFTSPYFEKFEDRICINGKPIPSDDLVKVANRIKPIVDELKSHPFGEPTPFEIVTAICFFYFGEVKHVDIALIEVGLGGRHDSTNVLQPLLTIITNVGYDHLNVLGTTLQEIAFEKAGIIKEQTPLITAVDQPEAIAILQKVCATKNAPLYEAGKDFSFTDLGPVEDGELFSFTSSFQNFERLKVSLLGTHQLKNATLSVMAALLLKEMYSFSIKDEAIITGLAKAYWPGRFEILSKDPFILIDGAHNKDGLESFKATLSRHYPDRKGTILFSALRDKQLEEIIPILDSLPHTVVFTEFDFPRVEKASNLFARSQKDNKELAPDWQRYLEEKIPRLENGDMFIATGSLYFISLVKPFLRKLL